MIAADLLQALILLPLLIVTSADLLWLLYLVRAGSGTLSLLFSPAESAFLPRLVGEERLVTANALNSLNDNLGRLVGPAAGGLLYATGGLPGVLLVDSLTFIVSALLIFAIRSSGRPETVAIPTPATSVWAQAFDEGIDVHCG
jgi:predicted MFS family arabinose efflux permease